MKTVLHIITGLDDGGAEAVLFRLCTKDTNNQHYVVSLMDSGKYGPLLKDRGISVECLGFTRGRVSFKGIAKLFDTISRLRPDAIQTWMYHANFIGGIIARLTGNTNIFWGIHHTDLDRERNRLSTIYIMRICGFLSRFIPKRTICCGERSRQVHLNGGYCSNRVDVIPNGYDLTVFYPDARGRMEIRRELGLDENQPVIGYVARFDAQKDHQTLLHALALLKSASRCPVCLLVGTGIDQNNQVLIKNINDLNLGDRVVLLGRRNDIPKLMNAIDFHVMSSSFGEAFPNVLAEAMACGTPCVSTDVGDAPLILGQAGCIVPPNDPIALSQAIRTFLNEIGSPKWINRCELGRKHIAENYTIERMIDSYNSVWFATRT